MRSIAYNKYNNGGMIVEILEAIYQRKSTRNFRNVKVSNIVLKEIICAGIQAPSPKNDQPWHFLIVGDKEKQAEIADILERQLRKLKEENDRKRIYRKDVISAFQSVKVLREASVIIFVYLNSNVYEVHDDNVKWALSAKDIECTHIMSVGAAIQNMLLAATQNKVDSLWMGDIFYAYNDLKAYLGEEGCIMAALALGYGIGDSYKSSRKTIDKVVTYI